jgi:hypothetical protein
MGRIFRVSRQTIANARGVLQLGAGATVGVTTLVESVHLAVLGATPLGIGPAAPIGRGLARTAYAGVRGATRIAARGGDEALRLAGRLLGEPPAEVPVPLDLPLPLRSVLNGIAGDRLARMANPLAIPMSLEAHGRIGNRRTRTCGAVRTLFIHGLCMTDRHWQDGDPEGICFGEHLHRELGHQPIYLRYNTGLAIAENGQRLATLLEEAFGSIRSGRLNVVAHSLGGLVIRSALADGLSRGHRWPSRVAHVVSLGTPHQGAPLERGGKLLDALLAMSRFSAPFAAAGRLRSAAIRQLGDADVAPVPDGSLTAQFHAVAGTLATTPSSRVTHAIGDGLVPTDSALANALAKAVLPVASRRVFAGVGHLALIRHPHVGHHVAELLAGASPGRD